MSSYFVIFKLNKSSEIYSILSFNLNVFKKLSFDKIQLQADSKVLQFQAQAAVKACHAMFNNLKIRMNDTQSVPLKIGFPSLTMKVVHIHPLRPSLT